MLKRNEAPSFASVAHKIGEPRLERVLEKLADHIRTDIHNAKFTPLRSEVRSNVKQLKADAQQFEKSLNRIDLFQQLHLTFHDTHNVRQAIRNVIKWCDQGLSIVSGKAGRRKQPGRAICAMIVIEAWTWSKGKAPGANNPKVHAICDEYWLACGNQSLGDPRNWQTSMADVLASHSHLRHVIRDEIRAHEIAP